MSDGMWTDLLAYMARPGLGAALVVLGATAVVTLLLEWIYRTVFRRIAGRTSSAYDDRLYELLHHPVRNTALIIGVSVAISRLGLDPDAFGSFRRIAVTVVAFLWFVALVRVLGVTMRNVARAGKVRAIQPQTVPLFDTLQKVVLAGGLLYVLCLVWRVDVTAWMASAGIVGIAVGFAAKDTLANLFSGVFILVDAPYRIGDMIVFDTGERGRVTDVGMRSTRILTRDDVEVIIPNATIGVAKIVNESGGPHRKRRVDVRVGVAYDSDIGIVRAILGEVADELDLVCTTPEPRIRFREMGESSLVFSVLFWITDPEMRGQAIDAVNTRILERFRVAGIEIPFPQRVVHWDGGREPGSGSAPN